MNGALVFGMALCLGACASTGGAGTSAAETQRPLPASVQLDHDLLMEPIARDARGCVQYRMRSARRPSITALFYRTHAGDFSTIAEEAACT